LSHFVFLLYVCQSGGLLMIVGGFILIYKQKIKFDAVSKETEVEVPLFGRLRTNTPALALFFFGLVALIYPARKANTEYLHVSQHLESNSVPVTVYAAVTERAMLQQSGTLEIYIPVIPSDDFSPELVYVAPGGVQDRESVVLQDQKNGVIVLQAKSLQAPRSTFQNLKPDIVAPPASFTK
jgi:hypothetical protein